MSLNRPSATGNLLSVPEEKPLKTIEFPVVGKDNDGLLITMSIKEYHNLPKEALEEVNTYKPDGYDKMVSNLVKLLLHRSPEKPILSNSMSTEEQEKAALKEIELMAIIEDDIEKNYDIKHFGAGNAYEFYISNQLNRTDTIGRDPLSPAWKIIVEKNNVSEALAMNLRDTTKAEGNIIVLRLDERTSHNIRRNSAAKPSIIKLKVCNWGWMNECVAKDQIHLGKTSHGNIIPSDQYQTQQTKNPENFPTQIAIKQLTLTRQEIIESLALGNTIIDEKNTTNEYLAVSSVPGKNNAPNNIKIIFRANMTPEESIIMPEEKNTSLITTPLEQPNYWKKSWGDFNLSLQHQVKTEYKISTDNEFTPLETYVIPVSKNKKELTKNTTFNPIQHGFENHNPGIQSNIDSLSLAVDPNGVPRKLENEKKLVKYLVDNTEDQVFHINQSWSMKQNNWGQLVESQIKSGVDVAPGTVTALLKEYNTNAQTQFDKPLLDACLALAGKLREGGREIRLQLCHFIANTLQPDHTFTREDFGKIQSQMNIYDLISKDQDQRLKSQEAYKVLEEGYTSYIDKQPANRSALITEIKQQESAQSATEEHKDSFTPPKPNS